MASAALPNPISLAGATADRDGAGEGGARENGWLHSPDETLVPLLTADGDDGEQGRLQWSQAMRSRVRVPPLPGLAPSPPTTSHSHTDPFLGDRQRARGGERWQQQGRRMPCGRGRQHTPACLRVRGQGALGILPGRRGIQCLPASKGPDGHVCHGACRCCSLLGPCAPGACVCQRVHGWLYV